MTAPTPITTAPWRRSMARGALVIAAVGALAVAVIVVSAGGGPTPAYAVVSRPDGSTAISIRELIGVAGANKKLAALGLPVHIVRSYAGCRLRRRQYRSDRLPIDRARRISRLAGPADHPTIVIKHGAIPAGDQVVIAVRKLDDARPTAIALQTAIYVASTPPCLPAVG